MIKVWSPQLVNKRRESTYVNMVTGEGQKLEQACFICQNPYIDIGKTDIDKGVEMSIVNNQNDQQRRALVDGDSRISNNSQTRTKCMTLQNMSAEHA